MRVMLVDDEAPARQRLQRLLSELGHQVVAEAADWEQALERARDSAPELVLLDIALPGHDGLWVAQKLREMQIPARVVFVTAHDDYALEAFEQAALDYLLKPVRRERLEQALQRVEPVAPAEEAYHTVRKGKGLQRLALRDIWFFRAEDKVVLAFDGLQEHLIEPSLRQLEERYGERFVRIHRAYLVDCHRIERLEQDVLGRTQLWLRGYEHPLPVSRRMASRVRGAMHC